MKVVVLFTMKGRPFCGMIKEVLDDKKIEYVERDIDENREEYDAFSEATQNEFIPAFMLMTFDEDNQVQNVKLCAPDRDFEDIFEGVKIVEQYLSV